MASITIRNLDDTTKERLRVRAARHGRSMEEEARIILRASVVRRDAPRASLAAAISRRFRGVDTSDLVIPAREAMRKPPKPGPLRK
jgi:plasmid stability protein